MDRTSFEHVYLYAHAIGDLGFWRATAAMLSAPPPEVTPEQRAENAAIFKDMLNPDPATFNWDAYEGIPGFDAEADAAVEAENAARVYHGPTYDQAMEEVGVTYDDDGNEPPEVGPYLDLVHAARELMQEHITACWEQFGPAVEALVSQLPGDLAPITSPLTLETFLPWLERHEAHDNAVETLVAEVRALKPM